ncbi:hypothetical protein G7Z17_g301 [Cylindrodendrum hubeiense]|uniref:Mannose-6-phosphate isomerase n=1 Tax=Cylindrodendrum hubeiense TaxID=595255 RepID=A0A9P5LNB4_9HYPO|nr:hypothetical protein G7Z17_g301 [Cylindrodendrum hubeiense]
MATPIAPYYQLKCGCNQYPWGKKGSQSLAAQLCAKTPGWDGDGPQTDFQIDEGKPYAEMWMGTYPTLPSYVASTGENLQDILDRNSKELLGDRVVTKFGHTLPFLPKILSIAKALPLQLHPNKKLASQLHREDPSAFTDSNHKPEIALALTEFEAFCGFKPLDSISAILKLAPFEHFSAGMNTYGQRFTDEGLRKTVQSILEASDETIKRTFESLRSLPDSAFTGRDAHIPQLASRLARDFSPTDPGILVGLLTMNYVVLEPGECIYIPADGIHAYIAGDIIECMARSNNVLNTGFCPKAERNNAKQFCSVLTFEPHDKEKCILKPGKTQRSKEGRTRMFETPTREFNLLETALGAGEDETLDPGGPAILIATKGSAMVQVNNEVFKLSEGHVYFVAHGIQLSLKAEALGLLMYTAYTE